MAARPRADRRLRLGVALALALAAAGLPSAAFADARDAWRQRFEQEVDRRLDVPEEAQKRYLGLLDASLAEAGVTDLGPQMLVTVDRSVRVQAVFVLLRTSEHGWFWIGAAPVSTGRTGSFDHFRTPLGVFAHGPDNPDFRAEGTFNENHIRGYGARGMRVFDFGWVIAERGWGAGGHSLMRLQMHATDPDTLEPRLGRAESKGCIRIPATLNVFLDRHGVLDADYEDALAAGKALWVLRADRIPVPWPGRYLVVVDSGTTERPNWALLPGKTKPPPAKRAIQPPASASNPSVARAPIAGAC